MSIIKGKTNIVAGFGGTKRPLGEVYFSQSSLASDNPGALPGWTGEYYENGKTLFPDLYNFVKAHSELQVTKAQYDSAIATYGECPKYVVDENGGTTTGKITVYGWLAKASTFYTKKRTPVAGDPVWSSTDTTQESDYTVISLSNDTLTFSGPTKEWTGTYTTTATGTGTVTTPGTSLRLPKRQTAGRYLVKKEVNGNNWYALYSDGWLEQGGVSTGQTVAFLKSFANTNYTLTLGHEFGNSSDANVWLQFAKGGKTTTGFTYANATTPANTSINWEAKGYAAGTPMENIMYPWISAYTSAVPASTADFTGELNKKVSKSGDTMTGNLLMSGENQVRFGTADNYYYIGKAQTDQLAIFGKNGKGLYLQEEESHMPKYWDGTKAYRLLTTEDLSNIDYVVESQVNSDGSWYRKYKSGWLEQGGKLITGTGDYTFLKPYASLLNVTIQAMTRNTDGATNAGAWLLYPGPTNTGFEIIGNFSPTYFNSGYWYAVGQGAN